MQPTASPARPCRVLTKQVMAERLGCTVRTIERLIEAGDGPPLVRITQSRIGSIETEFEAWIASRAIRRPLSRIAS